MKRLGSQNLIIVGAGIGGLSAAIYLRRKGFQVTVFEQNERVGGRASLLEREGFRFDTGPSLLNYPWVFEQLFKDAGRSLSDYLELLPIDPSITFRWVDGTKFTLSSDLPRLLEECERLEPGCSSSLFAFLRDAELKYQLTFEKLVSRNVDSPWRWFGQLRASELFRLSLWRSLDGELKRFFKSRQLREALGSYGMYLGGSPFDLPGIFSILSYGELAYGLWLPRGGVYRLIEGIEKLAREMGIEIRTNCQVRTIVVENGGVRGVELDDGSRHSSKIVISNVDLPTTNLQLLASTNGIKKGANKQAAKTKMTPAVITFYWGVHGSVPGLGHHTIFLPQDCSAAFRELFELKRIPQELPFYVSVPSAADPELAPKGDTTMFVLVPVPLLSELPDTDWEIEAQKIKAKVLATLLRYGVALDPAQIAVEERYTPATWQRRFGLFDGSAFGSAHTISQVGPFRSRNFSADIAGLFYVGASTTPGTGMPMVVLSGRLVAERILGSVS